VRYTVPILVNVMVCDDDVIDDDDDDEKEEIKE
jgi:hypothetical protein